ncbi:hypothetical protein C8Q77DRAFT_1161649 [Trametes polyzona]|nr:hypothetical protein C8Q77DRAFT_1161649 [Trametes polyzona]
MNAKLRELTGNRRASLRYLEHCYAERVVLTLKYKLVGWPKDIPYRRFGNIPRREQSLRRLLALWDSGELHFEPVTANDHIAAKLRPETIIPGYRPATREVEPVVSPADSSTALLPQALRPSGGPSVSGILG